jgi:hypothetical protein
MESALEEQLKTPPPFEENIRDILNVNRGIPLLQSPHLEHSITDDRRQIS